MSRSRRSSESPPEFFADRCLGKGAPRLLTDRGWVVHLITDHFPNDAQDTGDPEWVEYGLRRGWSLLTQDRRIATQPAATRLLREHTGCIYCLDSATLPVRARAERFDYHRKYIAERRRPGFYVVHADRVVRMRLIATARLPNADVEGCA